MMAQKLNIRVFDKSMTDGQTDIWTDGPTDGLWTDKQMDFLSYRDEMTHLKTEARAAYFV